MKHATTAILVWAVWRLVVSAPGASATALRTLRATNPSPQQGLAIPLQLVLTAKDSSMERLPLAVQKNVNRTISTNPDLRVRWFSDADCLQYLAKHFDSELVTFFKHEKHGSYRGDLCRAAVLAREGGFYLDLDVELSYPLTHLVDPNTTFMTATEEGSGEMLNAIMGAAPFSAVIREQVESIREVYRSAVSQGDLHMGPRTLAAAVASVINQKCQGEQIPEPTVEHWACGDEVVRLYKETLHVCMPGLGDKCSPERVQAQADFMGTKYALVDSALRVVGWSRFAACRNWGCDAGGLVNTPL